MINHKRNFITPSDEYYTTKEEVEYIFTQIIDNKQLENKIIYCPCDGDESEFTKWIEEHKDEYKLKEFLNTSDDFNKHLDIFENADIVITNPPFSKIYTQLLPIIKQTNCKFFLFGSQMSIYNYIKFCCTFIRRPRIKFNTPFVNKKTNDYYVEVDGTIYMTNLIVNKPIKKQRNFLNKSYKDITVIGDGYLVIDKSIEFPYDYDKPVLVPLSFYDTNYFNQFTISLPENLKRISYNDKKSRYVRILAQRKPEYIGQKFI